MQNGHPTGAYASRVLTETEPRYAQIEKMLAIVFSVETVNDFTYGRRTVVHTDHKSLGSIFTKPLHRPPKRLQGKLVSLQKYDLVVQHERGGRMFLADTLSRAL